MSILPGKRAEAANGDPITVGGNHTGTLPTSVTLTTTGANNNAAIHGSATAPTGDNFGLWGETNSVAGAGVVGNSNATTGVNDGVYGETNAGGAGVVGNANIDPQFAAIADMDDNHLFVSGYDSPGELTVSERTPCGFRVTAKDPAGTNAFSWRLVARRKDIAGERLAPLTIPPEPAMPPGPPNGIERRQTRRLVVSRARG